MSPDTAHTPGGHMGAWELDVATQRVRYSTGFERLFAPASSEPLTLPGWASLLTSEHARHLTEAVARCIETRSNLDLEIRAATGGAARLIEVRAELQVDEAGTPTCLKGIAYEAPWTRFGAEGVQRTALLLRAVLENASGLIYAKDRDGRMLIANPPTLQLIGQPWERVEGRTDAEFLEDRTQGLAVMANDRRIMDSGLTEVLEELVGTGDGRLRTWLSTKTPLRDESGAIIGLVGISQDITDRKTAEKKLVELNGTLEARVAERTRERDSAWNRSLDLLLVLDGTGMFRAVNPAWTSVLGWEHDELVNHNVLEFIHPDDYAGTLDALGHAVTQIVSGYQNRYRHKDGGYRWIEWSAAPEGDRVHASGRHVTAQKEAEMALAEKTAQLQASNKELESFSYSISHDLRAPLRAIDGFGSMLEEECASNLGDEGRRLLSTIRDNSRRMGQLIDDLLAFSRLSHAPLAADEVDVDALVREVIGELSATMDLTGTVCVVNALHPTHGDRQLLRQVWINLLSNAVKYSAKQASPRITVQSQVADGETIYSVRDNGVGFDMKYGDKLFGVFQRLHSAKEFSGTGVGLAIVHRILSRHGGRVWASGVPNQGAEFSFALPAKGSNPAARHRGAATSDTPGGIVPAT